MHWMKAQLVCYAYGLDMGDGVTQYEAKWTFNPSLFNSCSFGVNWNEDKDLVYPMGIGAENANVGTLMRNPLSKGCSMGSVNIKATPIEDNGE
jgi:hypothetical protein